MERFLGIVIVFVATIGVVVALIDLDFALWCHRRARHLSKADLSKMSNRRLAWETFRLFPVVVWIRMPTMFARMLLTLIAGVRKEEGE